MDTTDVRNLVTDALHSIEPPYAENVIDEVFFVIESSQRWLQEYEGLCLKHGKSVVNSLGGYWIGRELGKVGKKQVPSKKSTLIGSYSVLDTDAKPHSSKPKEPEALQLMAEYYKANSHKLPAVSEMKKHREYIVVLIMDGLSPEDAFNIVLRDDSGRLA